MSSVDDAAALRRRIEEMEDELERFRMTLEVVGTIDVESGILNRNGVLEGLERGRRWLIRRGDLYGLVVVVFPRLRVGDSLENREALRHLAASITAGVREVDEVGRLDDVSFGAVLQDLKPGSVGIVTRRMSGLMSAVARSLPVAGEEVRIGGVEVHNPQPTSPAVLDAALDLAHSATDGEPAVARI